MKNCTKNCKPSPHICDCDFMNGQQVFLTEQDRKNHEEKYLRGETNFAYPFEPWVIETWRRHSENIGASAIAEQWRKNLQNPSGAKND